MFYVEKLALPNYTTKVLFPLLFTRGRRLSDSENVAQLEQGRVTVRGLPVDVSLQR